MYFCYTGMTRQHSTYPDIDNVALTKKKICTDRCRAYRHRLLSTTYSVEGAISALKEKNLWDSLPGGHSLLGDFEYDGYCVLKSTASLKEMEHLVPFLPKSDARWKMLWPRTGLHLT